MLLDVLSVNRVSLMTLMKAFISKLAAFSKIILLFFSFIRKTWIDFCAIFWTTHKIFNTLGPKQNGCNFFRWTLLKLWKVSLSFHLTHWGRVMHICVSKLTIIGSDNGSSPGRRQAIISTNAGILLIEPLGTNFSEILSEIQTFSFKKMHLKMSSAK